MDNTISPLLSLPKELRLEIWALLLSPHVSTASRHSSGNAFTTITRKCFFYTGRRYAHRFDDIDCPCSNSRFQMLYSRERLAPQILRVSRQVHGEALPSLYARRMFEAKGIRPWINADGADATGIEAMGIDAYESQEDYLQDTWFLMDQWLQRLGASARCYVRAIALPLVLGIDEVPGARTAFYSISSRLAFLQKVELQVCPDLPWDWFYGDNVFDEGQNYWLGPIMAFAHAGIDVSAVDFIGWGPDRFGKMKTAIEMDVWRQLLPLRTTRDSRRIRRIQRALEAIEYADVEGLREDSFTDAAPIHSDTVKPVLTNQ